MRLTVLLATTALWASSGAWAQSGPMVLPQPGVGAPPASSPARPAAKPAQRSKATPKPAVEPASEAAEAADAPSAEAPPSNAPAPAAKPAAKPPRAAKAKPAQTPPAQAAQQDGDAPAAEGPTQAATPPSPRPPRPRTVTPANPPAGPSDVTAQPSTDPAQQPTSKPPRAAKAKPAQTPPAQATQQDGDAPAAEGPTQAATPPSPRPPMPRTVAPASPPAGPSDVTAQPATDPAQQPTSKPQKASSRSKPARSKEAAAQPKLPPEPVREPPPALHAADLRDPDLLTDGRLLGHRATATKPPAMGETRTLVVTRSMGRSPRSLYLAETLSPPGIAVYDALLQAPDATEAAPVALNSFEAIQAGAPAGPFRAGLVEEVEAEPGRPRIDAGTVTWRYLQPDGGTGSPTALTAEVVIDRQRLKVMLTLRPDRSPNAPSPLAIDIAFVNAPTPVTQIGMPELRNPGIERGVPLYGTVAGGARPDEPFTIVLSNNATDGDQNVKLLTGRPWIDIPLRMQNGKRLTLAFEKGTAVREMMRSAFSAWRLPWLP